MSRVCQVTGKKPLVGSQRQPLEPPHQAALRGQPPEQAVLARGREALDHASRLRARDAPDRQARSAGRARRAARPRREVLDPRLVSVATPVAVRSSLCSALLWRAVRGPRTPERACGRARHARRSGATARSLRGVAGDGDARRSPRSRRATRRAADRRSRRARGETVAWTARRSPAAADRSSRPAALRRRDARPAPGASARRQIRRLRGEPGAVVVALDARDRRGALALAFDASEWAVIARDRRGSTTASIVGGSFGGTLRVGATRRRRAAAGQRRLRRARHARPARSPGSCASAVPAPTRSRVSPRADRSHRDRRARSPPAPTCSATPLAAVRRPSPFARRVRRRARRRRRAACGPPRSAARRRDGRRRRDRRRAAASSSPRTRATSCTSAARDLVAQGPATALVAWWRRTAPRGHAVLVGGLDFDGAARDRRGRRPHRRRRLLLGLDASSAIARSPRAAATTRSSRRSTQRRGRRPCGTSAASAARRSPRSRPCRAASSPVSRTPPPRTLTARRCRRRRIRSAAPRSIVRPVR